MKNKVVSIGFVIILCIFLTLNIIDKDKEISTSERRRLKQFPNITLEDIVDGKTEEELNEYVTDQFVLRDSFRNIKSFWSNYIFKQKDNNGLFLKNSSIYKIEYPLNKEFITKSAKKISNVYNNYLNKNMNVYYAIIPDKSYYLKSDHLKINIDDIEEIMKKELPQIKYIDIKKELNLDDYYRTDLHWKQENIRGVVSLLEKEMNLSNTSTINYEKKEMGDFYGAYYGQLGMNVKPDKISILTNETIENAVCYNYETNKKENVYNISNWKEYADKYDIYLSGATPIIEVENKNIKNNKELILFRDSFGSSIAPLLLNNYDKITLVDLRYMSSSILDQYIDFKNQDVLFLYSTIILNQNALR